MQTGKIPLGSLDQGVPEKLNACIMPVAGWVA